MDQSPLITVEDLAVSFPAGQGKRMRAADRVNLSIYPGQTLTVVGESGSGKSVTALSILQLIPVPPGRYDRGRILWRRDEGRGARGEGEDSSGYETQAAASGEGPDSSATDPELRSKTRSAPAWAQADLLRYSEKQMRGIRGNHIAMIFQEPMTSLNPVYTIGEQILEAVLLHQHVSRNEAVDIATQALEDVGIADPASRLSEYPHQLSGGMRQRVMIAMALACEPDLLLADEPTTALDVTIQAQILDLLKDLQTRKGMAIMLITHDLGVVAQNADVVAVMYAGRICEYARVEDLFARPLHPYTRGLLKSMPVLGQKMERLPTVADGATIPEDFPGGYVVAPHDPHPNQIIEAPRGADTSSPPELSNGYGGHDARLYEVEPGHWVLCTPAEGNEAAHPSPPRLTHRRALQSA